MPIPSYLNKAMVMKQYDPNASDWIPNALARFGRTVSPDLLARLRSRAQQVELQKAVETVFSMPGGVDDTDMVSGTSRFVGNVGSPKYGYDYQGNYVESTPLTNTFVVDGNAYYTNPYFSYVAELYQQHPEWMPPGTNQMQLYARMGGNPIQYLKPGQLAMQGMAGPSLVDYYLHGPSTPRETSGQVDSQLQTSPAVQAYLMQWRGQRNANPPVNTYKAADPSTPAPEPYMPDATSKELYRNFINSGGSLTIKPGQEPGYPGFMVPTYINGQGKTVFGTGAGPGGALATGPGFFKPFGADRLSFERAWPKDFSYRTYPNLLTDNMLYGPNWGGGAGPSQFISKADKYPALTAQITDMLYKAPRYSPSKGGYTYEGISQVPPQILSQTNYGDGETNRRFLDYLSSRISGQPLKQFPVGSTSDQGQAVGQSQPTDFALSTNGPTVTSNVGSLQPVKPAISLNMQTNNMLKPVLGISQASRRM